MAGSGVMAAPLRFLRLGVDLHVDCKRDEMDDPPFADITDVNFDEREKESRGVRWGGRGGSMTMMAAHPVHCH